MLARISPSVSAARIGAWHKAKANVTSLQSVFSAVTGDGQRDFFNGGLGSDAFQEEALATQQSAGLILSSRLLSFQLFVIKLWGLDRAALTLESIIH